MHHLYFTNLQKSINNQLLINSSNYLRIFIGIYSFVIITANCFDPRIISLAKFSTQTGAILFPFTYILLDMITEVYGYKNARQTIWIGFIFNTLFLLTGQVIIFPASPLDQNYLALNNFLNFNIKVFFFCALSYFITKPLNSYIIAKVKIFLHGKYIGLRLFFSTLTSQFINALIFCTAVFYSVLSYKDFILFLISSWLFMLSIELLFIPFSIKIIMKIKELECLDIYNRNTNFNLFKLDSGYLNNNNVFK